MRRKQVANLLKASVARRMVKKRHAVNFVLGLCRGGRLRADVLSMTIHGEFTLFEIKSGVPDFLADSKADKYLRYCHKMYFVFEDQTWDKLKPRVQFPPQIGVIVRTPLGKLKVVKKSRRQEMDPKIYQALVLRMAYRAAEFKSVQQVNNWAKANS